MELCSEESTRTLTGCTLVYKKSIIKMDHLPYSGGQHLILVVKLHFWLFPKLKKKKGPEGTKIS
jgi:hypothetical protein